MKNVDKKTIKYFLYLLDLVRKVDKQYSGDNFLVGLRGLERGLRLYHDESKKLDAYLVHFIKEEIERTILNKEHYNFEVFKNS